MRKFQYDCEPLLLATVIGDRLEVSLRRALIISDGSWAGLMQDGFSRIFIGAILLLAALQLAAWWLGFRKKDMQSDL